jgi:deazaflavin-dependent oxidoreductase (nitroreductase family)
MPQLEAHAARRMLRLTTIGRRTGRERTVDVWFVLDDGGILVQAGVKGERGWYANLRANPNVKVDLGGRAFVGVAEITPPDEQSRADALFRRKYWLARVARWFGSRIGRGKPVRIRIREE